MGAVRPDPGALWARHDAEWRDPAEVASQWEDAGRVDRALLRMRVRGSFWEALERAGVALLVSREYEHLLVGLSLEAGRPRATFLRLPHPSGIAVDRERGRVVVASTRNPNQLVELAPVTDEERRPLVPLRSAFFPGSLYLHDLAFVGGGLHGNAVGQNAVVRIGLDGRHERVWWPRAIEREGGPDFSRNYLQLNSIAAGGDLASSYFTASATAIGARRPGHRNFPVDGRGALFAGATREPVATGLTRPHSARFHGGTVWVANSGYGEVGPVEDGRFATAARLPGWTRGLCFHGHVAFAATSRVIPRFRGYAPGLDVDRSVCGVHAIDTGSGEALGSLVWPQGNQIFGVEWVPPELGRGLPFPAEAEETRRLFSRLSVDGRSQ